MLSDCIKIMAAKNAEKLYDSVCSIYKAEEQEKGGITKSFWKVQAENLPCRVSYVKNPASFSEGTLSILEGGAKLFLQPDTAVTAGSRIEVTTPLETVDYECTGEPRFYMTHTEVEVKPAKRYC